MIRWITRIIDTSGSVADEGVMLSSGTQHNHETSLRWLFSFIRPQRKAITGLLALSLLATAMVLLQPWLTKLLIDNGLLAKDYGVLLQIAGAMVLVGIFNTLLSGFNRYCHTRLSGRILFALREDLYQHLQKLSPSFYSMSSIVTCTFKICTPYLHKLTS